MTEIKNACKVLAFSEMWGLIADGVCGKENVDIKCGIGGLKGDPELARYMAVR